MEHFNKMRQLKQHLHSGNYVRKPTPVDEGYEKGMHYFEKRADVDSLLDVKYKVLNSVQI